VDDTGGTAGGGRSRGEDAGEERIADALIELVQEENRLTGNLIDLAEKRNELADRRTMAADLRTSLAHQRTELVKEQTRFSRKSTELAERNDLAVGRTDLSSYRSLLARERTELAFIRTGLAFVAIGIALMRYFGFGLWTMLDGSLIGLGAWGSIYGLKRFMATQGHRRRFDRKVEHLLAAESN
jgi:uncharacterized membrane protein YidH (DUF202 family)